MQLGKTCLRQFVLFLLKSRFLNLHLDDLPGYGIQLCGHGVHLGTDLGAGLVHKIDGLVRQEPVGDIPVGQGRGGDDGGVGNLHAVEHLIALLQATQNGDGVLHGGFIHLHRLEPALQSRVLFNILPVLVQSGCADAVELATSQQRLQEIARVHAALGLARAHNGVQLINEQDNFSFGLLDLVQNGFQTFLKFAPVLRAGNQGTHVQRENGLILQGLGYILLDNPLSKALGDGSLAYAWLANQHGVVLGFPGQNPDDVSDFLVPADDRVHFLLPCPLDQVCAVLFQSVIGTLRVVGGDPLVTPDGLQGFQGVLFGNAVGVEQVFHPAPGGFQQA